MACFDSELHQKLAREFQPATQKKGTDQRMSQEKEEHKSWKREYSLVLILNLVYILVFYLIMTSYN